MNKVSIVIPVYNIEEVISHSLDAVVGQTYKDIELILVDDGSTDNSINVAEDYLKRTNMNYIILHQSNKGPSASRNKGIENSKGEWILCLDGDDYILPDTIERMLSAANEYHVSCVFCGFKGVDDESLKSSSELSSHSVYIHAEDMRKLFFERTLVPIVPGMLLRRSVYDAIHYDEACRYCEDTLFLWELFYELDEFVYIKDALYNYYRRENSTMHSLKPSKYLLSSPRHKLVAERISKSHPDDHISPMIYPKFRLGGLRIICRNNTYEVFRRTVKADGGNDSMEILLRQSNVKLWLYALLFCISKRLFYIVSK